MIKQIKKIIDIRVIITMIVIASFAITVIIVSGANQNAGDQIDSSTKDTTIETSITKEVESTTETTTESTTEPTTEPTSIDYPSSINFNHDKPYYVKVNRVLNYIVIYGIDFDRDYSVPYKAFICSVGDPITNTPLGVFSISDKYDWRLMIDNTYAQYVSRITGQILFHSVGYYSANKADLKYEEYNKLGTPASLGCIRLTCADAKWIYENCLAGTTVEIYDDEHDPSPIDITTAMQIPIDDPNKGWDPTDDDIENPWNQ